MLESCLSLHRSAILFQTHAYATATCWNRSFPLSGTSQSLFLPFCKVAALMHSAGLAGKGKQAFFQTKNVCKCLFLPIVEALYKASVMLDRTQGKPRKQHGTITHGTYSNLLYADMHSSCTPRCGHCLMLSILICDIRYIYTHGQESIRLHFHISHQIQLSLP